MRWLWCLLFGCPDPTEPDPGPDPPQGGQAADAMSAANAQRAAHNLNAFEYSECLASQAQSWAEEMQSTGRLSHNGFSDRLARCNSGAGSENVAQGYATGVSVVDGWMNSSGHRRNLLGSYNVAGVGYASEDGRHWWCMLYAKKSSS